MQERCRREGEETRKVVDMAIRRATNESKGEIRNRGRGKNVCRISIARKIYIQDLG